MKIKNAFIITEPDQVLDGSLLQQINEIENLKKLIVNKSADTFNKVMGKKTDGDRKIVTKHSNPSPLDYVISSLLSIPTGEQRVVLNMSHDDLTTFSGKNGPEDYVEALGVAEVEKRLIAADASKKDESLYGLNTFTEKYSVILNIPKNVFSLYKNATNDIRKEELLKRALNHKYFIAALKIAEAKAADIHQIDITNITDADRIKFDVKKIVTSFYDVTIRSGAIKRWQDLTAPQPAPASPPASPPPPGSVFDGSIPQHKDALDAHIKAFLDTFVVRPSSRAAIQNSFAAAVNDYMNGLTS